MRIASIDLASWRNYPTQRLDMATSPTILVGENGQGKTNFVEAIVYAALGRSHRTWADATLVQQGNDQAIIRMRATHGSRALDVDIAVAASGSNTVRVNGNVTKRRELARLLPLVIFAPEDMGLVRGEPEQRRAFIDDVVAETRNGAASEQSEFDRVLRQRNALLKSMNSKTGPTESTTLETWTDALIEASSRIIIARRHALQKLGARFSHHYSVIAGGNNTATITLVETVGDGVSDDAVREQLREKFHVKRHEELERGTTLVGPHRDDLYIELNGLAARTHSSQGEAWSAALSLRLAMVDVVRESSTVGDPVVILDDVFSELDEGRRARLAAHLTDIEHLIVTAADESTIPEAMTGERHIVRGGAIDA